MAAPAASDRVALLSGVPLFADLSREELAKLAEMAHTRRLRAREELCHKGDPGSQIYIVVSGRLKATTPSAEGKEMTFSIMGPGEVLGEMALLDGGPRSATVEALEACELLSIDRRDFLPFLERHPRVAIKLLATLAGRVRTTSALVEDTLFLNLPNRLAKKLLELSDRYGRPTGEGIEIELRLSQTELANLVGTTRESVNKQIRAWADEGVVDMRSGRILIRQVGTLEDLAEQIED